MVAAGAGEGGAGCVGSVAQGEEGELVAGAGGSLGDLGGGERGLLEVERALSHSWLLLGADLRAVGRCGRDESVPC